MKVALTPPEGPAGQVDILEVSPRGRAPRCWPLLPEAGEGFFGKTSVAAILGSTLRRREASMGASKVLTR